MAEPPPEIIDLTPPNRLLTGSLCGRHTHLRHCLGNTAAEHVQAEIPTDSKGFGLECYSDALPDELGVRLGLEYIPTILRADIFRGLRAGVRVIQRNLQCGLRLGSANSSRMQPEPGSAWRPGNGNAGSFRQLLLGVWAGSMDLKTIDAQFLRLSVNRSAAYNRTQCPERIS